MAEISRPHDTLTQLSLISGAEHAGEKKRKRPLSLFHIEKSPGRIKPIKSNCIQKTTGVNWEDSIVMLLCAVNMSVELTVTNNQLRILK
ncbi:hypothetical protein CDAR_418381 [Caerostris darwini]|uniref:Uncharacterized protein n=1 Tax=Caerostris darwini TaxID=1538125 RepID=A0AAV4WFH7_9ARAC|nr:hypothetical protein CDAR_418381 [Caerostris darwini]